MPIPQKTTQTSNNKSRTYDQILGIKVDSTPKVELLTSIREKLAKKVQFTIVTPNPEIILEAQSNLRLAHSLNSADYSLPDGVGLTLANHKLQIIKGREFMLDLFALANELKLKVYLLGSTRDVINKSLQKIKHEYEDINIKGNPGPKLNKNAETDTEVDVSLQIEAVKEINSFKPDLLFVAFGAPKQEIWIEKNLKNLNVLGVMAVGGSLNYYSNSVRSVPILLSKLNLEWLWRLFQQPSRITRIFKATVVFPLKLIFSHLQF